MLRIRNYLKIVPKRHCSMPLMHRTLSSYDIRHRFLDYFIKSIGNAIIRSRSPAAPFRVPSFAFVNAQQNQSSVFLGRRSATCCLAVNSGKIIGVEGKHESFSITGTDDYHRSFFEMLGNWSFLDYFKKSEACASAWNLLKRPCRSNSSRLHVTYFGEGDEPLKDFIDIEMKDVIENSPKETHPFIVHFLTCATLLESVHLQRATQFCTNRPILVLSSTDGQIKATCCVPQNFVTEKFSAHLWLTTVANLLGTEIYPPTSGLNRDEVCHMKPKKLTSVIFDEQLEAAMQQAIDFAKINM